MCGAGTGATALTTTACVAPAAATSSSSLLTDAARSHMRCVSPRQKLSAAYVRSAGSAMSGGVRAAATMSRAWIRATPVRSSTSARRSRPGRGAKNSLRYGSRSSAATTSRRASRSVATSTSSANPGCPRFSCSTSVYRRPSAPRPGCAVGAAPRIRSQMAFTNSVRAESASIGEPISRHHQRPAARRPADAWRLTRRTQPAAVATERATEVTAHHVGTLHPNAAATTVASRRTMRAISARGSATVTGFQA